MNIYHGCNVENIVWQRHTPMLSFDVCKYGYTIHHIDIQNYDVLTQLRQLLSGHIDRAILLCGMADIDIWCHSSDVYRIEYSPLPGVSTEMFVSKSEIEKIIMSYQYESGE